MAKRRTSEALAILVGLIIILAALAAPAQGALLATATNGGNSMLYSIDVASGAATSIGALDAPQVVGLATRAADGVIFAASGQLQPVDLGTVFTVDAASGHATSIGPPADQPNGPIRALAFSGATLYAACNYFTLGTDTADSLCTVDTSNGVASLVQRVTYPGSSTLRGIEALEIGAGSQVYIATGTLFAGGPSLFTVDLGSGQATLVGKIRDGGGAQIASSVTGLQLEGGALYGLSADGRLLAIDPLTAVYALIGATGIAGSAQSLAHIDLPPTPTVTAPATATATNATLPPTPTATAAPCSVPGAANPCIPGGGAKTTDCYLELIATPVPSPRRGFPGKRVVCYEGDPACDEDADLGNHLCSIRLELCLNNADPRLPECAPLDVATFEVRRPNPARAGDAADTANVAALENAAASGFGLTVRRGATLVAAGRSNNTPAACAGPVALAVPLKQKKSGVWVLGRKTIRVRARSSLQRADVDAAVLECQPSTCGNHSIESHEECDDGNRLNGDGCNQACHLELLTPTPVPTATATSAAPATATPTAAASGTPTSTGTPPSTATITETPTITNTPTITSTPADTAEPTSTFTPGAATNTPTPTSTRTPLTAVCPNGLLESGEECDACTAGELCSCAPADCSICAADCAVAACTPVATPPRPFRVDYTPPEGQPVTAIKLRIGYRSQRLSLPGSGPTPAARVTNRPSNTTTIVNDVNYALEVTMSRSAGLVAGRLFNVNFDGCQGQPVPALADLACAVLDCGSSFGPVAGCTCTVTVP